MSAELAYWAGSLNFRSSLEDFKMQIKPRNRILFCPRVCLLLCFTFFPALPSIIVVVVVVIIPTYKFNRGVQADPANGPIVPQAVLGLLRMVAGKDNSDVVFVEERGAGCIDASREPSWCIAHDRSVSGNRDQLRPTTCRWNTLRVD